jgi:hypothetical protein
MPHRESLISTKPAVNGGPAYGHELGPDVRCDEGPCYIRQSLSLFHSQLHAAPKMLVLGLDFGGLWLDFYLRFSGPHG